MIYKNIYLPMTTITAAVMTKNEAKNIDACLQTVMWMDEIIVLDCGSTDGTQNICRQFPKVKLIETDWQGFGEQSNRALEATTSEWMFLIDADERMTPELKDEILQVIDDSKATYSAFKVPRLNYFYKRPLKHCVKPQSDTPLRLCKKGKVKFQYEIHPRPIVDGAVGILKNLLVHYAYTSIEAIIQKINSYSTAGAKVLRQKKVKPGILKAFWHAGWAFIKIYFFKLGFLDGWPGFLVAFSCSEGTFYRYAKLLEDVLK